MSMQQNLDHGISVPLKVRLTLSHAYFQHLANRYSVDLLHVKGYAFGTEIYREGRASSDIDVLVCPEHLKVLIYALKKEGWRILTHFETGSIFEHAMTVYHPAWGLADIHRFFPGLGSSAETTFQLLWDQRREKLLGGYPCAVPSLVDSRIIVITHDARSQQTITPDVQYLQQNLNDEDWNQLEARVDELDCRIAYLAALDRIDESQDSEDYLIWKSFKQGTPVSLQWKARLSRAKGIRGKIRVLNKIFWVNKDHLAMELGHSPSTREVVVKFFSRFSALLRKK